MKWTFGRVCHCTVGATVTCTTSGYPTGWCEDGPTPLETGPRLGNGLTRHEVS